MYRLTVLFPIVVGIIFAQEQMPYQHLAKYVADVKAAIPQRGTNAFHEPPEKDLARFTECMKSLLEGQEAKARSCLGTVHYSLGLLSDVGFHRDYLVAFERRS